MKKYHILGLLLAVSFLVSCAKEDNQSSTEAPFEGKFKYSKCYTYKLSDNGTFELININTHRFNNQGKMIENIDSLYDKLGFRYVDGYKNTYFGEDSIYEKHNSFTYQHYLSNNRLISTFIQGDRMLFTYSGNHMIKMVLPAFKSNPEDVYQYNWDNQNNLTEIINNDKIWKKIENTNFVNENNNGEFWESGRHSMHHPLKCTDYTRGTVEDYSYHITNDGFADTIYTTKTSVNPSAVVNLKMVYIK